ncbi:MAG TPA: hypothetical protein VLK34_08955 [Nocardioidaceae bacterium]|nr:hypothetical protein [Nocardioidaceae bacterium]
MDVSHGAVFRAETRIAAGMTLAGAIGYLLAWAVILVVSPPGPRGPGEPTSQLVSAYADHSGAATLAAMFIAVFLVGPIAFMAGLRSSMRERTADLPLLEVGLAAIAISVALDSAAYSIAAAAAGLAADGAEDSIVVALDTAGHWLYGSAFGPLGAAVIAAGVATLRARVFPPMFCWLAIVAGGASLWGVVLLGVTEGEDESGLADVVTTTAALGIGAWMIIAGGILWRRR